MYVCINPPPLCKRLIRRESLRKKQEKRKRREREKRRRKDFRYDIASRYLNRLAATCTHCVKLISIFGDGRERVKNLERGVYVIPRQNQGAGRRGYGSERRTRTSLVRKEWETVSVKGSRYNRDNCSASGGKCILTSLKRWIFYLYHYVRKIVSCAIFKRINLFLPFYLVLLCKLISINEVILVESKHNSFNLLGWL